jgi:hypothetical protein
MPDLVGIKTYESPSQKRNYVRTDVQPRDDGHRYIPKYDRPVDNTIIDWLEANTLVRMIGAMPGHSHSDFTYLFKGSNGVLCAIHPEIVDRQRSHFFTEEDHVYLWRLNIRHQPSDSYLPDELRIALSGIGFNEVEPENKPQEIASAQT